MKLYLQQIYHKKSLKSQKAKSRNKTNIKKQDIYKSLIIVSPEREVREPEGRHP